MLPVVRTDKAEADLEAILDYLEGRSPAAAERLAKAIDERCRRLGQLPRMGRAREELQPGLRSVVVDKYTLFYRVTPTAVQILRILHGARDIDRIMKGEDGGG
jgi:toxin ParE1/3/4